LGNSPWMSRNQRLSQSFVSIVARAGYPIVAQNPPFSYLAGCDNIVCTDMKRRSFQQVLDNKIIVLEVRLFSFVHTKFGLLGTENENKVESFLTLGFCDEGPKILKAALNNVGEKERARYPQQHSRL
jgi:hypothetical protein